MNVALEAATLIRTFERADAPVYGGQQQARQALARTLKVAPGTLKNAREGRLKKICAEFFARLKSEEVRRLKQSILRAQHDLEVARAIGIDPRSADYAALQAAVASAVATLEEG